MQHRDSGGSGEPLVMLHAGAFADWFGPLDREPALAGRRRILVTRTGYADPPPATPMSIADHAAETADLLRRNETGPAQVLAHSSGVTFALQLALDHPDVVSSLVLSEPPLIDCLLPPAERAAVAAAIGPAMGAATGAAMAGDLPSAYDAFMSAVCGPEHRAVVAGALGEDELAAAVRDCGYFFTGEIPAVNGWAFDQEIAAPITQPVLLVAGGASPFRVVIEYLATMLPSARTTTIPGSTHLLPLTHPAALAELVAATAPDRVR